MQEIHKVGFVIIHKEGGNARVLLAKTKPGQWRFPDQALAVALPQCDKDAAEPFRHALDAGKTSYLSNIYFRDAREDSRVSRFFALLSASPDAAQAGVARVLDCETRWASFEEAGWVVAAAQLEVAQWAERLVAAKAGEGSV